MKKFYLFLTLLITACSFMDSLSEFGVDNKNCIGVRRFKVLQAIDHNTGLAFECFTPDCSDAYNNNLDLIFGDNVNEDLYDGMVYEVPSDKCAVRKGVYRYVNTQETPKTVSQIIFEYKNDYKSEEEHQERINKAKEDIYSFLYSFCMNSFEDRKLQTDEEYCKCYGSSFIDNNGDEKAVKKECGKLPKFLSSN